MLAMPASGIGQRQLQPVDTGRQALRNSPQGPGWQLLTCSLLTASQDALCWLLSIRHCRWCSLQGPGAH